MWLAAAGATLARVLWLAVDASVVASAVDANLMAALGIGAIVLIVTVVVAAALSLRVRGRGQAMWVGFQVGTAPELLVLVTFAIYLMTLE